MNEFVQTVTEQWVAQSRIESVAVLLSVAYVVLAARASAWCWPCAFISTALFAVLFFDVNLLQESALNLYYLVVAVYGWWHWRGYHMVREQSSRTTFSKQEQSPIIHSDNSLEENTHNNIAKEDVAFEDNTNKQKTLEPNTHEQKAIESWGWQKHVVLIVIATSIGLLSGYLSDVLLNASMPYLNGLSSWLAVFATYLVARKVLQNWLYWMVINPLSCFIFYQMGLYLTCLLMGFYFVMSIIGYINWLKLYDQTDSRSTATIS